MLHFTRYCHDFGQEYTNVYLKIKFEAEKIALSYREKDLLDTAIYRVGNLAFHFQT
jgi:thioester reductase-like protein